MGGQNNNAIGLKSNHTMVLSVDFICGVCSTNQAHNEKDASCSDGGTQCPNIKITTLFTTVKSRLAVSQSCGILPILFVFIVHPVHIE